MKFIIEESEAKRILSMHQSLKEQTTTPTKTIREQLQDLVDNGCVTGGTVVAMTATNPNKQFAIKKESSKTPGKFGYFFIDYTYGSVGEDGKFQMAKEKWSCSTGSAIKKTEETKPAPQLTPQQQKSVDDLINFYNKGPEPLYKKEEPTADQLAKKEWEKVNLKNEPGFKDTINFDYFIWKKTGLRQTKSPQQISAIKTYTDNGWLDIGGTINPTDVAKYDKIDLKDEYPNDFPESYLLVKQIESVDTNEIIEELNNLIKTKNFGDRKTCRNIINKYNVAKKKNAPINDAVLRNWKIGVNSCKAKINNFNDFGTTANVLKTLTSPTTDSEGKPYTPTEIEKRWDISLKTTPSTTPATTTPAGGTTTTP